MVGGGHSRNKGWSGGGTAGIRGGLGGTAGIRGGLGGGHSRNKGGLGGGHSRNMGWSGGVQLE